MYGKLYTEDALKWMGDNGIELAEVFLATFSEYTAAFGEKLRNINEKSNTKVHSIHTLNSQFEGQLFSHSPRQKQDAMDIFKSALEIGGMLKAQLYVLHGPAQMKYNKYVTDYSYFADITSELSMLAAQYKMQLTWENVHWAHYNHPFFMRNMRPYLKDGVQIFNTLDIKQVTQSNYIIDDYMEDMQGYISNVHITDVDAEGHLVLPGKGNFDFISFFHKLINVGADVPIMIEVYDGCYSKFDEVIAAYNYLKGLKI